MLTTNKMRRITYHAMPVFVKSDRRSGLGKLAFASLWFMVFAIPWQNSLMITGVGTIGRLIGLLAGGLGVIAIIERHSAKVPGRGSVLTTLFLLWSTGSYLWSLEPDAEEAYRTAGTTIQLLLMVWLIWELSSDERDLRRLIQAYVLGTFVSGADVLYRYLFHVDSGFVNRYTSTGLNPNDLALVMALSIPASYYLAITHKGLMRWICGLQLVVAGTTVLLTASRDGLLASLVGLTIVPLTFSRLRPAERTSTILTTLVLLCSGLFLVPAASWKRVSTIPEELSQGTMNERRPIWEATWEVFRGHPFVGVGAGAVMYSVGRTMGSEPRIAHNTFLSILVEEGVIGFSLFCALMAVLGLCAWEMPPLAQRLWFVTLGVWMVGVCGATWEREKATWLFFSLLVAHWASLVQKEHLASKVRALHCADTRQLV